ncbi:MAG: efflux transporter periplasmic adaptor subunit [Nitrospirae bacterium RBG_13_43_8]|nr:MAG: efflux transporter periplasmic adaptor subunit [Nitrospirae bacterium RBG_13_43_8]
MNSASAKRFRVTIGFILPIFLCLLLTSFFPACSKTTGPPKMQAIPVTADTVVQKAVPVQVRAIGNVEAYSTVAVKSQIGGQLVRVHFKEGQDVHKGDLLFTIDPRPYEAALKQAEANLAKDTAQLKNARADLLRYEELIKHDYVTKQEYDQIQANAAAMEATVNADKAVVENARLQLKYCFIYSPINGRTGHLQSDEGNLIKENADNPMVVINQIQPIYVSFSLPEEYLAEIKKYISSGKVKVEVFTTKGKDHPEEGTLTFIDNAVDISTGMIRLKATFSNKEKSLWPGQFLDVAMTLTTEPNAIIAPSQALQTGQTGQYVFVIKNDLSVEARPVLISRTIDGKAVVEKGLQPGEKVVTDGQLQLVPGAKVEIKSSPQKVQ